MERILNKIIGSFKKKYFLITFIFAMIIIVMSGSYSYWSTESGWQKATELTYQTLSYSITINNVATTTISSTANSGTVYYDVEITSLNDINTKYLLVYNSSAAGLTISVSSMSKNNPVGIIGKYGNGTSTSKTRIVRIAVTNNTANASTITLNVLGGYTWNDQSSITIPNGYYAITGYIQESTLSLGLSLADLVNIKTNCTPLASMPCYYSGNSNNYVSFDGDVWRILGSYIIGGENVTKLILDTPLATPTTYAGTTTALSNFYSTISNTDFVRTSSPFDCVGTNSLSCSGSDNIGLLSKIEHDLAEGANTFLYTTPDKYYWTNTESSSGIYYVGTNKELATLSGTSNAYVKPTIYLKNNIVAMPGTEGTQSNPYTLGYGYYVTVTKNKAFTSLVSGYYAKETEYSIGTILNAANYEFDSSVTGSGTSINTSTNKFTMGTESSSVTMNWWAKYTVVYNCNGLTGSTASSNHVENVAANLTTNGCTTLITGASGGVYNFLGWSTNSGATTATYTNGQSVTGLTTTGGATITLYAIYKSYFTYTGTKNVVDDGSGNWRVYLKTVNSIVTFTPGLTYSVDIFLVGGGGGGGVNCNGYLGAGGGGAGYTSTYSNISLTSGTAYNTFVGAGGGSAGGGGRSYFDTSTTYYALGGNPGSGASGANGGCGGGGGGYSYDYAAGQGGTNGSNAIPGGSRSAGGGAGQLTNTYEFGDSSLTLYGGGGSGGAGKSYGGTPGPQIAGGSPGGGAGGRNSAGVAGTAYTGGGGGGGGYCNFTGGSGGSGIIVIRNHR